MDNGPGSSRLQVPEKWKYGPDNGSLSSGREERVEKLAATSDFAVGPASDNNQADGEALRRTANTSACISTEACELSTRVDISPDQMAIIGASR